MTEDNEPILTREEEKAQGLRCKCHGSDDYCQCQNVADAATVRLRLLAQEALDCGGLPIPVEKKIRDALKAFPSHPSTN